MKPLYSRTSRPRYAKISDGAMPSEIVVNERMSLKSTVINRGGYRPTFLGDRARSAAVRNDLAASQPQAMFSLLEVCRVQRI